MPDPVLIPDLPCPACGYELADAPIINGSKLCPECGRSYNVRFLTRRMEDPTFGLILIRMSLIPSIAAAACVAFAILAVLVADFGYAEFALSLSSCAAIVFVVAGIGMPFAGVWAVEQRPAVRALLITIGLALNVTIGVIAVVVTTVISSRL